VKAITIEEVVEHFHNRVQDNDPEEIIYDLNSHLSMNEVKRNNPDVHRWYELSDIIYSISQTQNEDTHMLGYICLTQITNIFSETTGYYDIGVLFKCYEVVPKEVLVIDYVRK
jgi:deferrochelatase/peroxidase EfeB